MTSKLTIDGSGRSYSGWTSVSVTRGIESFASTFSVSLSHVVGDVATIPRMGELVAIRFDGELIITGHIERVATTYSADGVGVTVAGRSRTGDLVDCSADLTSFRQRNIEFIAANLAFPFGIRVDLNELPADQIQALRDNPFPRFRAQRGETVYDAFRRLAKARNVVFQDTPAGDVRLTTAGAAGDAAEALVVGQNIIRAMGSFDLSGRFSTYTTKSQRLLDESVDVDVRYEAQDAEIQRFRPLLIIGERGFTRAAATSRVFWEAATRAGNSITARYTLGSWRQSDGTLWRPNQVVRVRDPYVGWDDAPMLVVDVNYRLDGSEGEKVELSLQPQAAFEIWDPPKRPRVVRKRVRPTNVFEAADVLARQRLERKQRLAKLRSEVVP